MVEKKTYALVDLEPDSPCYGNPIGMWYNSQRSYINGAFSVLDAQYPSRKIGILCEQTGEIVETGGGRSTPGTGKAAQCEVCNKEPADLFVLKSKAYCCHSCYCLVLS